MKKKQREEPKLFSLTKLTNSSNTLDTVRKEVLSYSQGPILRKLNMV